MMSKWSHNPMCKIMFVFFNKHYENHPSTTGFWCCWSQSNWTEVIVLSFYWLLSWFAQTYPLQRPVLFREIILKFPINCVKCCEVTYSLSLSRSAGEALLISWSFQCSHLRPWAVWWFHERAEDKQSVFQSTSVILIASNKRRPP